MRKIDLREVANITTAISHYNELANYFGQLDPAQNETIKPVWDDWIKRYSKDGKYVDYQFGQYWQEINLHVVNQMWGSTACGWGGIGGAAMTNAYTVVIENSSLSAAFIYWGGKLAYVVKMDEKYKEMTAKGYSLPGLNSLDKGHLTVIYKNKNRR